MRILGNEDSPTHSPNGAIGSDGKTPLSWIRYVRFTPILARRDHDRAGGRHGFGGKRARARARAATQITKLVLSPRSKKSSALAGKILRSEF